MSRNKNIYRAGILPYIVRADAPVEFLFMKPSNPRYGGPDWQIAKGRVEDDDVDNMSAALREGYEELGLKTSNIISIRELGMYLGRTNIFICEVMTKDDFDPFHFETGEIMWMTSHEFQITGRELHHKIVNIAHDTINQASDRK